MGHYVTKRILVAIPLIFGVATVIFFISRLLPGNLSVLFLSPQIPPSVTEQLRKDFGLDQPLYVQYGLWLWGFVRGDFGFSFSQQQDVLSIIRQAIPYTFILAVTAVTLEIVFGILFVWIVHRAHSRAINSVFSITALITYTLPSFWVALLLLKIFNVDLGLLPSSHYHSVGADSLTLWEYLIDFLKHLILPAMTIALPGAAGMSRFLYSGTARIAQAEYVTAARSYGLNENKIFFSYILPNAFIPMITLGGLELGTLLTGALITEHIFSLPGMGRLTISAIFSRDYPLIVGCTMVAGVFVILANLVADVSHSLLDPRLRNK
jgi:peptide/nickel transport system permease protein